MKKEFISKTWWYRLLKVLYYTSYVLSLLVGFFIFPLVILFYEFIRGVFFYVLIGEWNFGSLIVKKSKIVLSKIGKYIKGNKTIGLTRLGFNLIFFLLFVPILLLIPEFLLDFDISLELLSGILIFILIAFLFISFYRLHNMGKSAWNLLWIFLPPPINLICLLYLIFGKKGELKEKYKKEKPHVIISVVILILVLLISFYIYQFNSLSNITEKLKNQETSNIENPIELCKKKDMPFFDISDKYVENTITLFYDVKSKDCFLLREFNSHGGNGIIETSLYNLENLELIGIINNQIDDKTFFATENSVYIHRLNLLLENIDISQNRLIKVIATDEIKKDIFDSWKNNYDKVLNLRTITN